MKSWLWGPRDDEEDASDDEPEGHPKTPPSRRDIVTQAVLLMLAGTVVCALFSDPLVEAVSSFSKVRAGMA